ncbi:MAG: hypothetical protein IE886_00650 [Campylobacterales bacterium]|nr:hypothetical protein [Campylobacterales bacterium]
MKFTTLLGVLALMPLLLNAADVVRIERMDLGLASEIAKRAVGAVGVSGAPGGRVDAACAAKALASLKERLAFALMEDDEEE